MYDPPRLPFLVNSSYGPPNAATWPPCSQATFKPAGPEWYYLAVVEKEGISSLLSQTLDKTHIECTEFGIRSLLDRRKHFRLSTHLILFILDFADLHFHTIVS